MIIENKKYGIIDLLRIPFQSAPMHAYVAVALMLASGVVPTLLVVATANFIDTALSVVQEQDPISRIVAPLLALVVLIAYSWLSGELSRLSRVRLEIAIREKFRTAIVDKRSKLAYRHIESHETWDLISRVFKSPESHARNGFGDLLNFVSLMIRVGGILVLLLAQVWWAALLIVAVSVPLFSLAIKSGRANYEASRDVSKYKRKHEYLSKVLTERETVEERALFGYGEAVNDSWREQFETARKIEYKTELKWFIKMKAGGVLTAFLSTLVLFVLLPPVLNGTVTIGIFVSLVTAIFGLVQSMTWELTGNIDRLTHHREYMNDLTAFAELEEDREAAEPPASPVPAFESLEFDHVRFKYPGTEAYILDDMSFRITAGMHCAFVGINGAGKTTIMKLLSGLYRDFEGSIRINGKPISEYSQSKLKSFYSIVYQDFAKYYISIRDNIAVGDIRTLNADAADGRIREAIECVGLGPNVEKHPKGLDTVVGKIKEEGQDLSGGEWQRIAMARALLNPAPIRILDEPTASLDPLSESKLYEEFEQISENKTTLFISHRLGSTKLADHIFVIGDGRVLESGSHDELMRLGGAYAQMYESQRSWYQ